MNIQDIDFDKDVVIYQAPRVGIVKLQKLNYNSYGFIYLQKPNMGPVFVGESPKLSLYKAMTGNGDPRRKKQCYVGTIKDLAVALVTGTILTQQPDSLTQAVQDFHSGQYKVIA